VGLASAEVGDRGVSPRARRWRWRHLVAAVVLVSVLAVGFVLWGPIGLGSGPLVVYAPSGGQILGPGERPWGLVVGLQAGNSRAVIDQVKAVGGAGYSGPHVLSVLEAGVRDGQCGGTFPWEGPQRLLRDCEIGGLHRLTGVQLPGDNPGVTMIFKIGPPTGTSGCWTITEIVVHYHVGIKHYTMTSSGDFAACKTATEEDNADLALGQPVG
jgi:hypothetical protein